LAVGIQRPDHGKAANAFTAVCRCHQLVTADKAMRCVGLVFCAPIAEAGYGVLCLLIAGIGSLDRVVDLMRRHNMHRIGVTAFCFLAE
jgi:hypothetical protein